MPDSAEPAPTSADAPRGGPGLWSRYRLLVGVSLLTALLDQALKAWVRHQLAFGEVWAPWPAPWRYGLRIIHWRNSGAAFGLYQGANDWLLWVAVAVIVLVAWQFRHTSSEARCLRWGLALQVGGALGNLWDRIVYGSVTDLFAVARFPVFNLADAAITFGVFCLLWSTLQKAEHPKSQDDAPETLAVDTSGARPSPPQREGT